MASDGIREHSEVRYRIGGIINKITVDNGQTRSKTGKNEYIYCKGVVKNIMEGIDKETYTSHGRVKTFLEHKEPDKVPFDLGGSMVTGININALRNLRKHLGLEGEPELHDLVTQMAKTGDDVSQILKTDVVNVGPKSASNAPLKEDLGLVEGHYRIIDEFGIGWQMPKAGRVSGGQVKMSGIIVLGSWAGTGTIRGGSR